MNNQIYARFFYGDGKKTDLYQKHSEADVNLWSQESICYGVLY